MLILETSNDATFSIQAVTPTVNDVVQPSEVCLLIEDTESEQQVATMTVPQAYKLIKALNTTIKEIYELNSGITQKQVLNKTVKQYTEIEEITEKGQKLYYRVFSNNEAYVKLTTEYAKSKGFGSIEGLVERYNINPIPEWFRLKRKDIDKIDI